jgi:DNA-binding response OmpR family regulator
MAKILVVEDDKYLVHAYSVKLQNSGFTVEVANDGEQALAMLATFNPDLVILDLVMPKKDGFTTLAELRQMEAYKNLPVLVASNLGQSDEVNRAKELGASDFVTKSNLSMSELVDKINSFLPKA